MKPWPTDCIIVVCETPENAKHPHGTLVLTARCRDCRTKLAVDAAILEAAMKMPERRGRPVKYICVNDAVKYDRSSIDILKDRRIPKEQAS